MIFSNLICLFSNQIDPENENTWDYSPPRPTTQCRGHVFQSNNTKFLIYHWQMFLCHYVIEYKPNLFSLKTILLHLLVFYWAEDMEFIEVLYCFSNSWVSNWKKKFWKFQIWACWIAFWSSNIYGPLFMMTLFAEFEV